ncbi:hypothetical protein [Pseudorhodoferax sp. Leaf267]|uniref:hypothetical protein n=1 Tax=Pseudorhodoferax sp. Leaf267 TaxID=1736316 RepID=UPI0007008BA4|nr:hypothetical protein [Pseudorhodoferax sp. Leaf267]KQP22768.1 hypothetical protein ASF43_02390 [Pseudorhodoferax sp. Leaf267]
MPHITLRIESAFGTLVDEQVDAGMVDRYHDLRRQGLQRNDLISALWEEELPARPKRAVLTGHGRDGRPLHIQILQPRVARGARHARAWLRSLLRLGR